MADLPSASNIKELVSLFAPGMILLWARSRVKAGPTPELQERLIGYAAASTAYFAAISPLFYIEGMIKLPSWLWAVSHYAVAPFVIGLALAYVSQREWEYKAARFVGLNFSHHIPAAWDYTFSQMAGSTYLLATLKDGSQVGGLMNTSSFASSSKDERDLLIEEVWLVDKNEWKRAEPPRSVLLCGGDINYIEIFKGG
ncbi:MAG: DUF6338 family protein [Sphingorhabdus sp.]|uniref:DUF6338 family protein n=1 Tax=Sphingorhabdus sp. TaxID=1902408 RepID=UPI003CBF2324